MKNLISKINNLKKTKVAKEIDLKKKQFLSFQKKSTDKIFLELCYCLLTANFNAKKSIVIQKNCASVFLNGNIEEIAVCLKNKGHRFPNARASYIYLAQKHKTSLKKELFSLKEKEKKREFLLKNIKGLGLKESSHFLRNIGFFDYAILDFHIIDILSESKIIEKPKTLNKKTYLEIEKKLEKLANTTKLSLGELDLYLWYLETGTIYK